MLLHAAVTSQSCADLSLSVQLPPHLGQILWSVTSFSILLILLLFVGMGLSYMPFFRRCSLLWWIWAPCSSWKEQRAFRGLSKTWRRQQWGYRNLNCDFCIPLQHRFSKQSYKAHNPVRFSVHPGKHLLLPEIPGSFRKMGRKENLKEFPLSE